jgi:hypothetical protein
VGTSGFESVEKRDLSGSALKISGAKITKTQTAEKLVCLIEGGTLDEYEDVRANFELNNDGDFLLTAYLSEGSLTALGNGAIARVTASALDLEIENGVSYFSKTASEYAKQAVETALHDHAKKVLREKAYPSYTFEADAANFLAASEFQAFKNAMGFGKRVYLNLNGEILTPFVTGVSLDFEDKSKFKLAFSSTYSAADKRFSLAKLLEKSVAMGKTLAANKGTYGAFVQSGAAGRVKSFMESAFDAAKNMILSSGRQAFEISDSGVKLRAWADDAKSAYAPEQIWAVNNVIAFTADNWETPCVAKI